MPEEKNKSLKWYREKARDTSEYVWHYSHHPLSLLARYSLRNANSSRTYLSQTQREMRTCAGIDLLGHPHKPDWEVLLL